MSLITPAEAQAMGAGVGLDTATLQGIIDREEAELTRRFGAVGGSVVEPTRPRGRSLFLRRAIASVTSVSEQLYPGDPAPTLRAASDYVVWADEGRIERAGGSWGWGQVVTVTYTPADDTALRKSILIELVRVAAQLDAGTGASETISEGGTSVTSGGATAAALEAARSRQYSRMGWLS